MKAKLNCIEKTISFKYLGKKVKIDLTEGDLCDSWVDFEVGGIHYCGNFGWEFPEGVPNFAVYPYEDIVDDKDGKTYSQVNTSIETVYDVKVENGEGADYFKSKPSCIEPKAYFNCVTKRITFAVGDESFEVDLTEGDLECSINSIHHRGQTYDTTFTWDEDLNSLPSFNLIPVDLLSNGEDFDDPRWDDSIEYDVVVEKGGVRDYFSVPFPNGFNSYMHTYGAMVDEVEHNGDRIRQLETIREWAWEFEEDNQYTDWEKKDWDDIMVEFVNEKLG